MTAAAILFSAAPAHADSFSYACKAKGKSSIVKINTANHPFKWGGKIYQIEDAPEAECPRIGWKVSGNGESFDFCTAT